MSDPAREFIGEADDYMASGAGDEIRKIRELWEALDDATRKLGTA